MQPYVVKFTLADGTTFAALVDANDDPQALANARTLVKFQGYNLDQVTKAEALPESLEALAWAGITFA